MYHGFLGGSMPDCHHFGHACHRSGSRRKTILDTTYAQKGWYDIVVRAMDNRGMYNYDVVSYVYIFGD